MSKKLPSEEIISLKRRNYWLIRDLNLCMKHQKMELDSVLSINDNIDHSNMFSSVGKSLYKQRNNHLDKHGLLVDLEIRIRREMYDNGKQIMKLRSK